MTTIEKQKKIEIDGGKYLGGDLYLVPLDLINTTSQSLKSGEISFINPRHAANRKFDKNQTHGFQDLEMKELREAIRSEGLEHPLLARMLPNGKLQLVAGERRYRCLKSLLDENTLCYNPSTDSELPAREVYNLVECRVRIMDDQLAFKMAFSENESSVPIGEAATLSLVAYFRECGYDDKIIMTVTNHGVSWLRETDTLLSLDTVTKEAFLNNEINRATALKLAKIDEPQRLQLLEAVKQAALERIRSIQKAAELKLEQVRDQESLIRDSVVDATHRGNNELASAAESKLQQIKEKVAERTEDYQKALNKKTATTKDLNKAAKKVKAADGEIIKSLSKAKLEKCWLAPVTETIKNKYKKEEDGVEVEFNSEDLYLIKLVCESYVEGQADIWKILKQHDKNRLRRINSK